MFMNNNNTVTRAFKKSLFLEDPTKYVIEFFRIKKVCNLFSIFRQCQL